MLLLAQLAAFFVGKWIIYNERVPAFLMGKSAKEYCVEGRKARMIGKLMLVPLIGGLSIGFLVVGYAFWQNSDRTNRMENAAQIHIGSSPYIAPLPPGSPPPVQARHRQTERNLAIIADSARTMRSGDYLVAMVAGKMNIIRFLSLGLFVLTAVAIEVTIQRVRDPL